MGSGRGGRAAGAGSRRPVRWGRAAAAGPQREVRVRVRIGLLCGLHVRAAWDVCASTTSEWSGAIDRSMFGLIWAL